MSSLKKKLLIAALAGTLLQVLVPSGGGRLGGCGNYLVYEAMTAVDACSFVNCDGGTFFNFCSPVRIFADCPTTTTP
jgi:hypothetical protein